MAAMLVNALIYALAIRRGQNGLPGCEVYHDNECQGSTIVTNESMASRRWVTPAQGSVGYLPSYQDYSHLVAYAHVLYSDATLRSATVELRAEHKNGESVSLSYVFDGVKQAAAKRSFTSTFSKPLTLAVEGSDGTRLTLEPVDFHWNAPNITARPGDYRGGQKGAIVELFGWPDADVEAECEFLGSAGYLGVKLFPHQEQLMSSEPFNGVLNPWYFMYQPVSYRLEGRMGTRDDLRQLVRTCRQAGVRVYADAVINHMTGGGNDMGKHRRDAGGGTCAHWGNKSSSMGGGPSPFFTQSSTYEVSPATGLPSSQEFPAAAYGPLDFHCERVLNSWNDPLDLNAGWLTGLTDLNTEREHVQERIAAYLTDLIGLGMSGFRIDAAKHIHPDDLVAILAKLRRNLGGSLPTDFLTWLEVLLGGEADLLMCDASSSYNYGGYLLQALRTAGLTEEEAATVKIWNSGYPKEPEKGLVGCSATPETTVRAVIQNDDADQQNPGSSSRDMGDDGCVLIKGCDPDEHRAYEVKLFEAPKGATDNANDFPIRVLLSSFYWPSGGRSEDEGVQGIPDGKSDCAGCTVGCQDCHSVPVAQAHDASSTGYDGPTYTRVHRDAEIIAAMRKWMGMTL